MMYYDSHIPLVRRCIASPNPVSTFRQELDDAGLWGRKFLNRMVGMKFMPEPDVKYMDNTGEWRDST
jgi:hypothetical protein